MLEDICSTALNVLKNAKHNVLQIAFDEAVEYNLKGANLRKRKLAAGF